MEQKRENAPCSSCGSVCAHIQTTHSGKTTYIHTHKGRKLLFSSLCATCCVVVLARYSSLFGLVIWIFFGAIRKMTGSPKRSWVIKFIFLLLLHFLGACACITWRLRCLTVLDYTHVSLVESVFDELTTDGMMKLNQQGVVGCWYAAIVCTRKEYVLLPGQQDSLSFSLPAQKGQCNCVKSRLCWTIL